MMEPPSNTNKDQVVCILTRDEEFAKRLKAKFRVSGTPCEVDKPTLDSAFKLLYSQRSVAAVVDSKAEGLPESAWLDLLNGLGRRIPVIVIGEKDDESNESFLRTANSMTWLFEPSMDDVVVALESKGLANIIAHQDHRDRVPLYNAQVPTQMLKRNNWLCALFIDTTNFRGIATQYGNEVYFKIQRCFHDVILNNWGQGGVIRSGDFCCRSGINSNIYYVFLDAPRERGSFPVPGALEKVADRVLARLQNDLWEQLFSRRKQIGVPFGIPGLPDFSVGYASAMNNPCISSEELIHSVIASADRGARVQMKRLKERRRELMQALINDRDLLVPFYQAVFDLRKLTKTDVIAARHSQSIQPIAHLLFGFESLIRVRSDWVGVAMGSDDQSMVNAKYLTPDVLFAMAESTDVALELDQACLSQATTHSLVLPGMLMLNILPRNLYYIQRLKGLLGQRRDVIFEVSESEAISNFDLMVRVRSELEKMKIHIALDDLGKGYAGLERIVRLKPDLIKFDRSLIQGIYQHPAKAAFVKGLVDAAQISGSMVLAEGVEEWEEAEVLKDLGINLIQGFLLHRPSPLSKIMSDLASNLSRSVA